MEMQQDLQALYTATCEKHGLQQNPSILSPLVKQHSERSSTLELMVENMDENDAVCLADFITQVYSPPSVDIKFTSETYTWKLQTFMALLSASKSTKLRHLEFTKCRLRREYVRVMLKTGLSCERLSLMHCSIKRLSMSGFTNLISLHIDESSAITSLSSTCFTNMPKLVKLSMCGTSILNLWTTCYALLKLPCLEELRFQRCICCQGTGPCTSDREIYPPNSNEMRETGYMSDSSADEWSEYSSGEVTESDEDEDVEEEEDANHVEFNEALINHDSQVNQLSKNTANHMEEDTHDEHKSSTELRYVSQSSICCEKFYREFMVASLQKLTVLDNLEISKEEREKAHSVYFENFEFLPNNRRVRENMVEILDRQKRGGIRPYKKRRTSNDNSSVGFCRTLGASKMASCVWPAMSTVYSYVKSMADIGRKLKPRQFEYHPTEPSLMVVGTLNGELAVVNHEDNKLVAYVDSSCSQQRVLGLSWLNKDPDMFIAGSDNGVLELYSLPRMKAAMQNTERTRSPSVYTCDEFDQLTSVHVNSTDEVFLASGYSKHVGLYDIRTAKRIKIYPDLHQEHINVVKFAHHSPSLFATSSFDKDIKMWDLRTNMLKPIYSAMSGRGNVMVCFSHDDHFLLSSAVDNEVRQYLAVDGRLHMKFDIAPVNSRHNYTRSYYMNGRDYIITGSCEENLVRICCAQTGRRLRDLTLEGRGFNNSLYVQSLRGDPFKDFHMCVLVAYNHPQQKSEIVKINMLAASKEVSNGDPQSSTSSESVNGA